LAKPLRHALNAHRRSSPRNSRARSGWFAWTIVVAGLVSALALVIYGVAGGGFGRDTHREWLELADALKKQGEPIFFADMKPADVPPEQNFFEDEVFAGLAADAPLDPLLKHAAEPGKGLSVADLLASATQGSGAASLDAIAATMQKAGLVRSRTDFLLAGDRVRAGMRALGLDFAPLAAAADRPASRFPIDYTQPFPKLPHLRYLEALGDWLAIHAMAQLSVGDSDSAATDLLLVGRLADSLAAEPFPASQRARRLLLGLLAGCVRVGIDWGAWSDDQLARFQEEMSRARPLADFAWAVRGERAQINSVIDLALSGRKPEAGERLQEWLGPDLVRIDMRGLRARQVSVDRAIQQFLDALTKTDGLDPKALAPEKDKGLPETAAKKLAGLDEEARAAAQLQTYLAQAEVACALERHRLARGAYPEKLDELVPNWLNAVPADPLTAKPLAYERGKDGGFSLTGAGWAGGQAWVWTRKP
jgi:hypothetical protein